MSVVEYVRNKSLLDFLLQVVLMRRRISTYMGQYLLFLVSKFRLVLNFLLFLLSNSPASLLLTLILRRPRTGTVWFYTSTLQQESSTTKTVHKVINRGLKAYV